MSLKRESLDDYVDEQIDKRNENWDVIDGYKSEFDELADEFTQHKLDYIQQREQDVLKVAKVERELNDYQKVMSQVNVNQEAKQKASGYGIVSLPPNAANGQVSATLKGETWTNLIDGAEVAPSDVRSFNSIDGHIYFDLHNGVIITGDGTEKTITNASEQIANMAVFDLTQIYGQGNEPTVDQAQARLHYITGTKSTVSAMRLKSVSEDESEASMVYVTAKDSEDKIAELRSLPNGTKDEVRLSDGKLIKRVGKKVFNGTEDWERFSTTLTGNYYALISSWASNNNAIETMAEIGRNNLHTFKNYRSIHVVTLNEFGLVISDNGSLFFVLGKSYIDSNYSGTLEGFKAYLAQHPVTLIYQLAEPIEIPVQVSGSIVSYPNGTIYIERILPDAGVYTDKITILHQDAPIKRLDKLSKVDFMTGVETELDINQAEISEDKISFTHPDLSEGDIVFFEYEYDVESTEGETEVEYYDSRYVVKDDVTGKFYKWSVKVSNGTPTIEVMEV